MSPALRRLFDPARFALLASALLLGPAAPGALEAQRADFLFGRPSATLSLGMGLAVPGEGSDLFAETRERLTVAQGDFRSPALALELGVRAADWADVVFGFEYAGASVPSEMRDWVTQDDRPIPQTTEFQRWRLSGGLKAYLRSRGRGLSEYAWVPSAWSPFLGAGVAITGYEFAQYGDFVDYENLDIFAMSVSSRGAAFTPWVTAGLDVSLSARLLLRTELRRYWGEGALDPAAYEGFQPIDLSGYRATLGLAFRTGGRRL